MKGIYLIFILSIICQPFLFSQVVVKRNNQVSKEAANVNWSKEFTLFDYTTDEPIFPLIRNGQAVFKIFYAGKEDLRPNYGEFSVTQVEGLKYYKFKNRETCLKFCLANKLIAVPTLTTSSISVLTTTSATSGGNITSDGGSTITARGVVWATTSNPTISLTTKTFDGTGIGTFTSALTGLTLKTTYYIRAYATNSAGTGYGNEISFTTSDSTVVMGIPCPGTPIVKDIDGNTYNTVQIGTQCWTKENLRVTKYSDGSIIPLDESGGTAGNGTGETWSSRTTGARTVYGHSTSNLATYGYLYNWYAAVDSKGLCPSEWHVPSDEEWTNLTNYLGGESVAGGKMKSIGTTYWISPNAGATNESGFSALPSGYRDFSFIHIRNYARFWSATAFDFSYAWVRSLNFFLDNVNRVSDNLSKTYGFSVRCLKDTNSIVSIPTITTTAITEISTTSATSGGNINSDGGATLTASGVVWSITTNPTITLITKTTDGTGTGSFTSVLTGLTPKTTYFVRAYATNSAGTAYGNEISFTTSDSTIMMGIPCPGIPTVKDIDGNTYNTVQIGTQCWTKENLRVTKYRDGTVIPLDESGGLEGNGTGETWGSKTTGARTVYGHSAVNLATFGYLYNWYAAVDSKGLCPNGWHVPSEAEWNSLSSYLGNDPGVKLADTSWILAFGKPTNESGFSIKPGGYRDTSGRFSVPLISGNFWSTTKSSSNIFKGRELYSKGYWNTYSYYGASGLSVRCLKDSNSIVSKPTLTTTAITAITTTSATSGGNITADGGATITARGIVWATSTNPTIALTTKTSTGTGTGSYTSSLNNLTPKTTYYVRAYATNSAGTGYGNEISFTTSDSTIVMGIPCPGTPTVKDIDGNTYNTVQIGTQCWTKENLRVTKYRDGTVIPLDESGGTAGNGTGQTWSSRTTGARTVYGHSATNLATYGYLYNWYAVADTKGLCPSGWHVPSDTEWNTLINFLGGESLAARKIKVTGTTYWLSPNLEATNESGFSALPSGYRSSGEFRGLTFFSSFFSNSELSNKSSFSITISNVGLISGSNENVFGTSVRCLRDTSAIVSIPTITTTAITSITTTSATSGGNITADGGASITARGIVWSTSTNPTIAISTKTSIGTGTGSFTSTLTNLAPKTTYYVRAYATNSTGTGYGNEISFTTSDSSIVMGIPCPGTPTVKDIDGNTYNTVQIGTQCWTKENLRVTKYRDGTVIPLDESGGTAGNGTGETWSSRTSGARTVYGHSAANLTTYGYLYNWFAVADTKGLCPNGWHIPSDGEWTNLTNYLGGESLAGGKMKSSGTTIWNSPNTGATNESGFSALPGGLRQDLGLFYGIRTDLIFTSSSENEGLVLGNRVIDNTKTSIFRGLGAFKAMGISIRCLKDSNSIVSIPSLTTNAITAIATTSANSGGNITADGGASIIAKGVVWSTSTNPTISLSTKTSNGIGTGSFSSTLSNLTPKTTYYVRAYATNSAGTGYGNEITFTTLDSSNVMGIPCPGAPIVEDIEGNTYSTVQIGSQCWTKQNLMVGRYRNGDLIPHVRDNSSWSNLTTGARCWYNNDTTYLFTYGNLYNWYAASDSRGLCPTGWHVPSDNEWTILVTYLGGESIAGGKMKSTGTTYWYSPNTGAINEIGFSALPGGYRNNDGRYNNIRNNAFFWSGTELDSSLAWYRYLSSASSKVYRGNYLSVNYNYKSVGASVRCLMN